MEVFVWGTGRAARALLDRELADVHINAFIDSNRTTFKDYKVYSPEIAVNLSYDAVIVATVYSQEIYGQAKKLGFDLSKFIFVYNNYLDMNQGYDLAESIFGPDHIKAIKNKCHMIRGMEKDDAVVPESSHMLAGEADPGKNMYENDYVRIKTFDLAVAEILDRNIPGAVAELGVFKGEFARYINNAFPKRTCYLFDTFEGFSEDEAVREMENENCTADFVERHKDTDEKRVLQIMPNPGKIVCRKGLFPESLDGLEDNFAFVSIDVDFEQSIYDGLNYFYPRLNNGGFIFVHDYNSRTLRGVRNAIKRYEEENGIILCKVPVPDAGGTLVITK